MTRTFVPQNALPPHSGHCVRRWRHTPISMCTWARRKFGTLGVLSRWVLRMRSLLIRTARLYGWPIGPSRPGHAAWESCLCGGPLAIQIGSPRNFAVQTPFGPRLAGRVVVAPHVRGSPLSLPPPCLQNEYGTFDHSLHKNFCQLLICSRKTSTIMVWAWMLSYSYALGSQGTAGAGPFASRRPPGLLPPLDWHVGNRRTAGRSPTLLELPPASASEY